MNFLTTLNFDNHKIEKNMKIWVLFMCLIIPYYYKKIQDEKKIIMKTKGPFMKIVLLNEIVKHPFFKPNFDIEFFFYSF
jgi:hypothetical protein